MIKADMKSIIKRLDVHEKRISALEKVMNPKARDKVHKNQEKQVTLTELIKNKKFKSGQEKIAVIVGYYEKIVQKSSIGELELKEGWRTGKFDGKYSPNFLARAIKAGWVRNIDSNLDLSQSGEDFFESFLKNEHTKTAS